ncbi:MAG: hypothetical protein GXP63_04690, partial [DPANN group archaeon]|nr:hypothetical protein [DPANN group archaeon]
LQNILLCYDDLFDFENNFQNLFRDFEKNKQRIWDKILRIYRSPENEHRLEFATYDEHDRIRGIKGIQADTAHLVLDDLMNRYADHRLPVKDMQVTWNLERKVTIKRHFDIEIPETYPVSIYFDTLYKLFSEHQRTNRKKAGNPKRKQRTGSKAGTNNDAPDILPPGSRRALARTIMLLSEEKKANSFYASILSEFKNDDALRKRGIPTYFPPHIDFKNSEMEGIRFLSTNIYRHNRIPKAIVRYKNAFFFIDGINYASGEGKETNDLQEEIYLEFSNDIRQLFSSLVTKENYEAAFRAMKPYQLQGSAADLPGGWIHEHISRHTTFLHAIDYARHLPASFDLRVVESEEERPQGTGFSTDNFSTDSMFHKDRFEKVKTYESGNYYYDLKISLDEDVLPDGNLPRELQIHTPLSFYHEKVEAPHLAMKETRTRDLVTRLLQHDITKKPHSMTRVLDSVEKYFAQDALYALEHASFPQELVDFQEHHDLQTILGPVELWIRDQTIRARHAAQYLTPQEKGRILDVFQNRPPTAQGPFAQAISTYIAVRYAWEGTQLSLHFQKTGRGEERRGREERREGDPAGKV